MSAAALHEDPALRSQLREARSRLDELEGQLRAVDGELEELAGEREQYALAEEACAALEKLDELGAAEIFWGEREGPLAGRAQLGLVRQRVDAFGDRIGEIEGRRQVVLDQQLHALEDVELLEDEIFEAQLREEERKLEWEIEREISALPPRVPVMPWARGDEADQRFRRSLGVSLALCLLLGLLLPWIELPLPELGEPVEVPERLARLIREEPLPPAPVVPESRPVEELVEESGSPEPKAGDEPAPAAEPKGILAFREQFSGLAEADPTERLGALATVTNAGAAPGAMPQRAMVATQASGSSGGINLASISRNVGGGNGTMDGVRVSRVSSSIGTGAGAGGDRPLSDGVRLGRTDEEIQIVFDRHKAALYRLYNRELRRNPTLKGQMVLRLTIEPDGSVSLCELSQSDMKAPELTQQVLSRVRGFDFGAKEGVPAITILYPIDFLPAA